MSADLQAAGDLNATSTAKILEFVSHLELWIKAYCAALVLVFFVVIVWMFLQRRRVTSDARSATRTLEALEAPAGDDRRSGRTAEFYDRLREASKQMPDAAGTWWRSVDDAVERYVGPDAKTDQPVVGYFLTRTVDELVTVEDVAVRYHFAFFHSFPSILTALGLLGTFIALLLGLMGLSVNESGTVDGLKGLISNLSGKFLTSITALVLSVLFIVAELNCQTSLRSARDRLARVLSRMLPYVRDLLAEIVSFHGGDKAFVANADRRTRAFLAAPPAAVLSAKRKLQEPAKKGLVQKYKKFSDQLKNAGFRFPSELMASTGVRILVKKASAKGFKAWEITDILEDVLHFPLTLTERSRFEAIRGLRNEIAHGTTRSISMKDAMRVSRDLHGLAAKVDKHAVEHFFVLESYA